MFTRLFILIFLSSGAFAQTGTLKVVAYANGTIKIDGEVKCSIVANEVKKFDLKADDYIVQFFPQSGTHPITKEVSILVGKSETINFEVSAPNQQNNNTTNNSNLLLPEMVFVQGGTFTMGCTAEQGSDCFENEKPTHSVTLSSYYIGKYEVTQKQWSAVMRTNPSLNIGCDECPVENVNWHDCHEFIQKLNRQTGKLYRLPTEAEWEYAARGGNMSKGYKYAGSNVLDDVAWYEEDKIYPVGQKKPNELGIYDMSGNVWEWCSDWYEKSYYNRSPGTNPQGPSNSSYRVLRGGCWLNFPKSFRVSLRYLNNPDFRSGSIGFRLVLLP